ncbi:hypothetical protein [Thiomicrorhabdus sp. 6S3-12]|uniref:hypothetical protein n=1 Tax=Thiomicrorhabdus sp. 6S3-12 TaxID=2819681 RepID=UPI001AAE0C86|nr:hypothetical protein [Thiomicrorhabdus sp. 6S3-12]MBO1924587.1 hypothetical protein [Thiomicrorhabdus sp. 6S3-12]
MMVTSRQGVLKGVAVLLLTLVFVVINGCAVTSQKALQPMDWVGQSVDEYPVTGAGDFDRLRNKPVKVGSYTAKVRTQSPWGSLSTSTMSSTDVIINTGTAEKGHELRSGSMETNKDAELEIHLVGLEGLSTDIRCRQKLEIEYDKTSVTDSKGNNAFSMSDLKKYSSTLNCQTGNEQDYWPKWQMKLSNSKPEPLQGVLIVDGIEYRVVGSRSSNIGHAPNTVSYDVKLKNETIALIDRSGDGTVSVRKSVEQKQKAAMISVAVALLLANDPLDRI